MFMQIDVDIAMKRLLPEMVNHTCNLPVPASGTRDQSFIMTHGGSKVPSGVLGHSQVIRDKDIHKKRRKFDTLLPPFHKISFCHEILTSIQSPPPQQLLPKIVLFMDQISKILIRSKKSLSCVHAVQKPLIYRVFNILYAMPLLQVNQDLFNQ